MSVTAVQPPTPAALREPVLEVEGLRIERERDGRLEVIVSSIELTLAPGEALGIVGESGSGKSMTAKAITGLLPPTVRAHGAIRYGGRNLLTVREREWRAIRGREIGLILQDPFTILNPVLRCGRIIEESLVAPGRLGRRERRAEVVRRLAEVGITDERVIDRYPVQLSGGMRQRVAIAAALARDPKVLIADEPSTALDVGTQREVLRLIKGIQRARDMALILITHDLRVAFAACDRIHVLYAGSLVETGPAADIQAEPMHPYTNGLLLSEPPADRRVHELVAIPGAVPTAAEVADRCPFEPRCRWASEACRAGQPALLAAGPRRASRCVRLGEIRDEMAALRVRAASAERVKVATPRVVEPLLAGCDLHKRFGAGDRATTAVDGVTIEVGANESVGVVGASGSGKTTLARMLIGLEQPTSGEIVVDGVMVRDWSRMGATDRRRVRGTVQIVFQDPYSSLNPMRSLGWTLAEAITTHDPAARHVRGQVAELLGTVGLPVAYAERRPVALSGGERQRVAIARALAARPKVLLCDEPVSALDMSVQAQILNLLSRLRAERGLALLFITHDLSIVRQVTEVLYVMHGGRLVESGPTDRVLDAPQAAHTIDLLASAPRSDDGWLR